MMVSINGAVHHAEWPVASMRLRTCRASIAQTASKPRQEGQQVRANCSSGPWGVRSHSLQTRSDKRIVRPVAPRQEKE
jgi:hypothetical protein